MPVLNERDFAKLASAVAQDYVERGIPLNDGVEKIASKHGMNDEQLKRMCEATNNATFNALFEQKGKQGSADRVVDFSVAKPGEIMNKRVASAKTAFAKTASAPGFDPMWERRPLVSGSAAPLEKTASDDVAPHDPARAARQATRDLRMIDKAVDHLRHEKIAAQFSVSDAHEALYQHFRRNDNRGKFPGFEKDAMALHGAEAEETLDGLRKRLGLPEVTRNYAKVASRVVVSQKGQEHVFLKKALDALTKLRDIQNTLTAHGR